MGGAIDTVLFDLDGTLLDTALDFANALNIVLARYDRKPLAPQAVRPHVSKGGMALVCLGFEITADDPSASHIHREFLEQYRQNICVHTGLFPGIESLLAQLESDGRAWGIVTNKPAFLTDPLLADMNLAVRAGCVVSGDTLATRKPSPQPLLHACEVIGSSTTQAVYIGDDERDIVAGRAAGMRTAAAAYGYIIAGDDPRKWGADAVLDHADEIQPWLASESATHHLD